MIQGCAAIQTELPSQRGNIHNPHVQDLTPNHLAEAVCEKEEILLRLWLTWYTNFKIMSPCSLPTTVVPSAHCQSSLQLGGSWCSAEEWAKDELVWLGTGVTLVQSFHVRVPQIPACESEWTKTSFLLRWIYSACPDSELFKTGTVPSKRQAMSNNKAIINVLHAMALVCRSH